VHLGEKKQELATYCEGCAR